MQKTIRDVSIPASKFRKLIGRILKNDKEPLILLTKVICGQEQGV